MGKITKLSCEELQNLINNSNSLRDVLSKVGLKPTGGNYKTLKRLIQKNGIDLCVMLSNNKKLAIERITKVGRSKKIPLSDILKKGTNYSSYKLKNRLISDGIFTNICSCCGLTEWMGKPLSMHLHHINGDDTDNRIENLKLLCPNCHSQTDNYTGKNLKIRRASTKKYKTIKIHLGKTTKNRATKGKRLCEMCDIQLSRSAIGDLCAKCTKVSQRKVERPSYEMLLEDVKVLGYCGTGRKYGVSNNAIKKWIKQYEK